MLVGVCCECQQSRIPVIYDSAQGYTIQQHPAFGSLCKGEGTAPQATYEWSDPAGPDQMSEGVQVVIGSSEHNVRSPDIYPDDFDREEHNRIQEDQFDKEEHEREQAKEAEKLVCCFDPWRSTVVDRETNVSRNHRPDPPKPPGIFGTIGDILLAAKNGNKGKRKKGT